MAEWSEDHVAVVCYFNIQHLGLVDKVWLNWRPEGALRCSGETAGWESRHLQDCSPRLCRLKIDGLTPVSKY
jgi:hypothetical protein